MSDLPLPDDKSKASDESKVVDESKASDESKAIEELKPAPSKLKHAPEIEHASKPYHKKHKKHAKHGAWKLVYADFVTVMMAFFIVDSGVLAMMARVMSMQKMVIFDCVLPE